MKWPDPPPGFIRRDAGAAALYVDPGVADEAVARGLDRDETWESRLAGGEADSGRGPTAALGRERGPAWRLKRMRRGGWLAALWGDRYPAPGRLVAMLALSAEAIRRGVPGARPVALLLVPAAPAGIRGWAAFEQIAGAEDLAARLRRGALIEAEISASMRVVRRMHDRGIVHPDLNLANLLVRGRGSAAEAFVIDFDRGRAGPRPVSLRVRRAALSRIERSCAKIAGAADPLGAGRAGVWRASYAGDDADLARRLARAAAAGRASLAWHRLGWRMKGR